jgi:hypothetical protein
VAFLATALAGAGWAASAYVTLVRLHVGVVDACDRVEAAGHAQLALVDNLLLFADASDSRERGGLNAVRQARERAGRVAFVPMMPDEAAQFAEFRVAHAELAAAIETLRLSGDGFGTAVAREAVDDLAPDLRRAQARLLSDLDSVDRTVQAYRSAASRFPGSLVAVYAKAEGFPGERPVGGL